MNQDLQSNLFTACPLLYKHFKGNSPMQIDCPDDLFEFLFELSSKIEDFNKRFPRRRVRALKVAMESGELVFKVHRQIFTVNKLITATAAQVKVYRRALKQTLLARAKAIQSTALFGSSLIPDWKRLMPDDRATLQKILEYAEKCAAVPQDHADLANWRKKYLAEHNQLELFKRSTYNGKGDEK